MNEYISFDPSDMFFDTVEEIEEMTNDQRYERMNELSTFMNECIWLLNYFHMNDPSKLNFKYLLTYAKYFTLMKLYNRLNEHCTEKRVNREPMSAPRVPLDSNTVKEDFPLLDMTNLSRTDSIIIKHYCYMLLSYMRIYANRIIKHTNQNINTISVEDYFERAKFLDELDIYKQPFIDQLKLYHEKYNTGKTIEEDTPEIDFDPLLLFPGNM